MWINPPADDFIAQTAKLELAEVVLANRRFIASLPAFFPNLLGALIHHRGDKPQAERLKQWQYEPPWRIHRSQPGKIKAAIKCVQYLLGQNRQKKEKNLSWVDLKHIGWKRSNNRHPKPKPAKTRKSPTRYPWGVQKYI